MSGYGNKKLSALEIDFTLDVFGKPGY